MREIKFRAWEECNKRWITEGNIGFGGACYRDIYSNRADELGGGNELIVCQFTGLKDKNGKEIYEGDIVFAAANKSTSVVKYGPYKCHWSEYEDDEHMGFYSEDVDSPWREGLYSKGSLYEVIGNIYENPELTGGNNGI